MATILVEDYLDDENRDMMIADGDYVVGASDGMHIHDILVSNKGEWKQWPLVGVGIQKYLNASFDIAAKDKAKKEIMVQLQYDGFRSIKIDWTKLGNVIVEAFR